MKKNYSLFSALLFFFLFSNTIQAQGSGIFDAFVITDSNGDGNFYHHLVNTGGFNGADLGDFTCTNSLILKGGQNKTYKNGGHNVHNGTLFYRIHPTGNPSGSFSEINLNFSQNLANAGDQEWDNVQSNPSFPANIDVLAGLSPGNYTLEVFTRAQVDTDNDNFTDLDHFWSLGFENNFNATFTVFDDDPIAVCQDITVQLDATGNATITAADVDGGSSDNCGIASMTLSQYDFTCADLNKGEGEETTPIESAWINEFHYDNASSDTGEFVEVAANIDVSSYTVVFYNGSNGLVYATESMPASSGSDSGYDFYVINKSGIQNGAPDGVALIDDGGMVVEFLSYEGSFTANNGPAAGDDSTDIMVAESGSTPAGFSLQLVGSGSQVSDFSWSTAMAETKGAINTGQTLVSTGSKDSETIITLTVIDGNGNISTCDATVTVEDNVAPTALCVADFVIELDATGNATITAEDVDNESSDSCGDVTLSIDVSTFSCSDAAQTGDPVNSAWINEFHYDNASSDTGEFVEVAANIDVSSYTVVFYNGSNGEVYATESMPASSGSDSGYDFYVINKSGIQNGSPDGVALIDDGGMVVEFLSYEGSFTANDGPAAGDDSTDIMVVEGGSSPAGFSLQLVGSGSQSSDFTWSSPIAETKGAINTGQTFPSDSVEVTLTVTDESGNESTCTVNVTVEDNLAPGADLTTLPDVEVECEVTSLTAPTATDNCSSVVTVSHNATLPISGQGTTPITWTYEDESGNTSTQTQNVVIDDVTAPDTPTIADATGECEATATAPTTNDNCSGTVTGTTSDDLTYNTQGTHVITWTFDDGNGNTSTQTQNVVIDDVTDPVISCPANITVDTDSDACGAIVNYTAPIGTDNCSGVSTAQTAGFASGALFPVGTTTNTFEVTDVAGTTTTCSFDVIVENEAPKILTLTLPTDPVDISNQVDGSATFYDENLETASWDWGDSTSSDGVVTGSDITGTHTYSTPGVYEVTLTLTDFCGEVTSETYQYVVIYDPSGGFVTGGGWIDSPEGAYIPDPSLIGQANFGFVSKYKKGQSIPDGNTEFQFQAGDLNFKSTSYDWLIIAGTKAIFKGDGKINGVLGYKFLLSAKDESKNGGDDTFRIKIWDDVTDVVVYDNQMGAGDDAEATTVIGGGSIIVHKPKGKASRGEGDIVDSNSTDGKVIFWPNPSKNIFNLKFNKEAKVNVAIYVYDMSGRVVHQRDGITNNTYQFGESLDSGIYFVNVTLGNKTQSIRLVKY